MKTSMKLSFLLSVGVCFVASFGVANAASIPTEIAVLSGVLNHGESIPLPIYADGTAATESQCHWLVSMNDEINPTEGTTSRLKCGTVGRVIECFTCWGSNDCVANGTQHPAKANYLIIAVRPLLPTPASQGSWGEVKSHYR